MKGSEDLSGGLSAIFKLESQFQLWSGKLDNSSNELFQRQAYVGLSSNQYGTFTLGVAEYSLSKRTEVYCTVDFTRGTGAFMADYPGRNNRTGVAIGLHIVFDATPYPTGGRVFHASSGTQYVGFGRISGAR